MENVRTTEGEITTPEAGTAHNDLYREQELKYITFTGVPVRAGTQGYEDYHGKLIHWHVQGNWFDQDVTNSNKKAFWNSPAFHFDALKNELESYETSTEIAHHPFTANKRSKAKLQFKVLQPQGRPRLTALVVHNLILEFNLHLYNYNNRYSGCQCWSRTLLRKLAERGYIAADAVNQFQGVVTELKGRKGKGGKNSWIVPDDDGTFFRKEGNAFVIVPMDQV